MPPTTTPAPLDIRIRLSALWTTTMILVAFVDIFAFYRADIRSQIESGRILDFEIGQPFMIGILLYVLLPTLMIALSVLLPQQANRALNIAVPAIFALTIVGAAIGEWGYYLLASAAELVLLAVIVVLSVRWRAIPNVNDDRTGATLQQSDRIG